MQNLHKRLRLSRKTSNLQSADLAARLHNLIHIEVSPFRVNIRGERFMKLTGATEPTGLPPCSTTTFGCQLIEGGTPQDVGTIMAPERRNK